MSWLRLDVGASLLSAVARTNVNAYLEIFRKRDICEVRYLASYQGIALQYIADLSRLKCLHILTVIDGFIDGAEVQNNAGRRQILQDAYNFEVQRKLKWHVPLTLWTTEIGFFCNSFKAKKMCEHMEPTAINLQADIREHNK